MDKFKTISVEKLYSILKTIVFHNKGIEDLYLVSIGNFKEEEYKKMAFATNSKLVLTKSIFSKMMSPASKLVASSLGVLKLSRSRETLFELFFLGRYGTLYLILTPKEVSSDEIVEVFENKGSFDGLKDSIKSFELSYKVIAYNAEDSEEIVYSTKSNELEDLARSSVSEPILKLVEELKEEENKKYSELEKIKITLSGIINNNVLNPGREEYLNFSQQVADLYMIDSFKNDFLEYVRLKAISYDLKMYNEIYLSFEYDSYPFRIFSELNEGLCWAFNYINTEDGIRDLTFEEKNELEDLKTKIYPIKNEIQKKIDESIKDIKFVRALVVVILISLFGGYKIFKKYRIDYIRKQRYEATKPEIEGVARDIVEHYYPSAPVDTKQLEKVLRFNN